jgi:hypothetical protein
MIYLKKFMESDDAERVVDYSETEPKGFLSGTIDVALCGSRGLSAGWLTGSYPVSIAGLGLTSRLVAIDRVWAWFSP